MSTANRPGGTSDPSKDATAKAFDEIIAHWDEPLPDVQKIEREVRAIKPERLTQPRPTHPSAPVEPPAESFLDALDRADEIMAADEEFNFVPPEPPASVVKPRNTEAFAVMVLSAIVAIAFAFFIDSTLSGAMTALGITVFISSLVYLAVKATENQRNNESGTL